VSGNPETPTKRVRMLASLGGADYSHNYGRVIELPEDLADRYVAHGLAEEATEYLEVEV